LKNRIKFGKTHHAVSYFMDITNCRIVVDVTDQITTLNIFLH